MEPQNTLSKTLPIILSILTSAVVFGGIGYYFGMNQAPAQPIVTTTITPRQKAIPTATVTPTASPTPVSQVDTTNWKTYTNSKYGFSFKYPQDWTLAEKNLSGFNGFEVSLTSPETKKNMDQATQPNDSRADAAIVYYPSISSMPDNQANSLNAKTLSEYIQNNPNFSNQANITVNGVSAFEVQTEGLVPTYSVFLEKNKHIYDINFFATKSTLTEIEKQILSSFKFTQ